MSGRCSKCGWTVCICDDSGEQPDFVTQLQDEVNDLMDEVGDLKDENAKLRRLCIDAVELLHASGAVRNWLVKCMRLQARLEEACDV